MAKALSPLVKQELENLDKDPVSRRTAMNALRTYVELLDTKTIPLFLAQVSDSREGQTSRQYAISLYEVIARVHGKSIIPQISKIMGTVVKTLSSSGGSLSLQQACARVVPTIARYSIDPISTEAQREGIIRDLCNPLLDVLLGKAEPLAAGAALCLQALVESENWKFASVDIINEVCLRVTGALEETGTRTAAHMRLVCSLVKSNVQILEAYGRSLIKSGIEILEVGVVDGNWQQRLSAVQMINSLLTSMEIGIASSELSSIIDNLETCLLDRMPCVRNAAEEALQTIKIIASKKRLHRVFSGEDQRTLGLMLSPGKKSQRRRNLWGSTNLSSGSSKSSTFGSQESQDVSYMPSPVSSGQSLSNYDCSPCGQSNGDQKGGRTTDYSRHKLQKQMQFENGGVSISLEDGILSGIVAESDSQYRKNGEYRRNCSLIHLDHGQEDGLKISERNKSDSFPGFGLFNTANGNGVVMQNCRPTVVSDREWFEGDHSCKKAGKEVAESQGSSCHGTSSFWQSMQKTPLKDASTIQKSRSKLTVDDFHIYTTPRRLIRSLQQQSSPESASVKKQGRQQCENDEYGTPVDAEWSSGDDLTDNDSEHVLRGKIQGRVTDTFKGRVLLDKVESVADEISDRSYVQEEHIQESRSMQSLSVPRTVSVSSAFSSTLFADFDKEEPQLASSGPIELVKGYPVVNHDKKRSLSTADVESLEGSTLSFKIQEKPAFPTGWKKEESFMWIVFRRSVLVVLLFSAAMMVTKCFSPKEQYHLLLPT